MSEEAEQVVDQDAMADEWAAAMEEQADSDGTASSDDIEKVEAQTLHNEVTSEGDLIM